MRRLNAIADVEEGWLEVVQSLIDVIPISDPLGPATITVLLDECPLPTKDVIIKLVDILKLKDYTSIESKQKMDPVKHRNIAMILGSIAEKLAGPRCIDFFTDKILDYLLSNLVRVAI